MEWAWELTVVEWGKGRQFRLRSRVRGEGEKALEVTEAEMPARLGELCERLGIRPAVPKKARPVADPEARRAKLRAAWTPERRAAHGKKIAESNRRRWARRRGQAVPE